MIDNAKIGACLVHCKHAANEARDQDTEQFDVARPFPENWKQRPREKRSSGSRCKRRQAAAESACDKMCWMRQEEAERWWFKACLDQNDRILCELWARSVHVRPVDGLRRECHPLP